MSPSLRLAPALPPEVHLDRLMAVLDGIEPAEAISLLTGALGRAMARLPPHEQAYAWFATTQSLMVELLPSPPPRAAA